MLDKRLYHHLVTWLGQWPAGQPLAVVGSGRRVQPAWDGRVYPMLGVGTPGGTVISVAPGRAAAVRVLADQPLDDLLDKLPTALGLDAGRRAFRGVFRFSVKPERLPDAGEWLPHDDPVVPGWLWPFGGEVLVTRDPDTGAYLAGVGIKRHDAYGNEISVGAEEAVRGRGLARRLVAQAARRILDEGAVPTYLHSFDNIASARVAEAAGFPERGWTVYSV